MRDERGATAVEYAILASLIAAPTPSFAQAVAPVRVAAPVAPSAPVFAPRAAFGPAALPGASTSNIPVGRFGTADEVSSVALMLAGNAYLTGQTINVDGGKAMH